jgi:hypothetical protein
MKPQFGSLVYMAAFMGKFRPYSQDEAGKANNYQCMACRNIVDIAFPGGFCYCCGTRLTEQMPTRPRACPRKVWDRYGTAWQDHYSPPYLTLQRWKINVKGFALQTRLLVNDDGVLDVRENWSSPHGFVSNERFGNGITQAAYCLAALQCDPMLSPDRESSDFQRQYRYAYVYRFIDDALGIHKENILGVSRTFVRTPSGKVWQVSPNPSPMLGMST